MKLSLREQLTAAIFAGIISIFSQIIIPLGIVPLSLQTFIVGVTASLLGRKVGTWSVVVYFLLGLIGLPVFAGGSSGLAALLGPTGGYLIGFLFTPWAISSLIKLLGENYPGVITANLTGFLVTLAFGSLWLKFAADLTWTAAFSTGFIGFLVPEVIKAVASGWVSLLLIRHIPERFLSF